MAGPYPAEQDGDNHRNSGRLAGYADAEADRFAARLGQQALSKTLSLQLLRVE
jgi:hypothetical protein